MYFWGWLMALGLIGVCRKDWPERIGSEGGYKRARKRYFYLPLGWIGYWFSPPDVRHTDTTPLAILGHMRTNLVDSGCVWRNDSWEGLGPIIGWLKLALVVHKSSSKNRSEQHPPSRLNNILKGTTKFIFFLNTDPLSRLFVAKLSV